MRLASVGFLEISAGYVLSEAPREKLSFDLPIVQAAWRLDGDEVDVQFPFIVEISAAAGSTPQEIARVAANIYITYAGAAAFSPDELRHFVGVSGFMHAWPYLRSEVQALTAKIGLPPLLLPLIVSGTVPSRVSIGEAIVDAAPVETRSPKTSKRTKATKEPKALAGAKKAKKTRKSART